MGNRTDSYWTEILGRILLNAAPALHVPPRLRQNRMAGHWKPDDVTQLNSWLHETPEHYVTGLDDLGGIDKLVLVQRGLMGWSIAHVEWVDTKKGVGLAAFDGVGFMLEYGPPGFPKQWMVVNRWSTKFRENTPEEVR